MATKLRKNEAQMQNTKNTTIDIDIFCKKHKLLLYLWTMIAFVILFYFHYGTVIFITVITLIYDWHTTFKICKKMRKEHSNKKISDKVADNTGNLLGNQINEEKKTLKYNENSSDKHID